MSSLNELLKNLIQNTYAATPLTAPSTNSAATAVTDPFQQSTFTVEEDEKEDDKKAKAGHKSGINYDDNMQRSSQDALATMVNSGLYSGEHLDKYFDRMVCAAEDLTHNDQWRINMDVDGDGTTEDVNLAEAIASSFDSELDLYIQEEVNKILKEYGTCSKSYLSDAAIEALALKGIRVDAVGDSESITNRAYTFSLIDVDDNIRELMRKDNLSASEKQMVLDAVYSSDAKVMEDADGKKGSYIFADCLIPDGYAQGAEVNLSSILDQMGYDCISKADFIGNEDEYWRTINAVKDGVENGEYGASVGVNDIYGNTKAIQEAVRSLWGGSGSAPGTHKYSGGSSEHSSEYKKQAKEDQKSEKAKENDYEKRKADLIKEKIEQYKKDNDNQYPSKEKIKTFEIEADLEIKSGHSLKL